MEAPSRRPRLFQQPAIDSSLLAGRSVTTTAPTPRPSASQSLANDLSTHSSSPHSKSPIPNPHHSAPAAVAQRLSREQGPQPQPQAHSGTGASDQREHPLAPVTTPSSQTADPSRTSRSPIHCSQQSTATKRNTTRLLGHAVGDERSEEAPMGRAKGKDRFSARFRHTAWLILPLQGIQGRGRWNNAIARQIHENRDIRVPRHFFDFSEAVEHCNVPTFQR